MGSCGEASKVVRVAAGNGVNDDVVPSVSIPGGTTRAFASGAGIYVVSFAYMHTCDGIVRYDMLAYNWSLTPLTGASSGVSDGYRSISRSPNIFQLPPYALSAGNTYRLQVNVTSQVHGTMNSASIHLVISPGKVITRIAGGNSMVIYGNATTYIDASSSYDEEIPPDSVPVGGLQFFWWCVVISPLFSSNCSNVLTLSNTTSAMLGVSPVSTAASTAASISDVDIVCRIYVTVYNRLGTISSTASTRLKLVNSPVYQQLTTGSIDISSLHRSWYTKFPPNQKLVIASTITSAGSGVCWWEVGEDPDDDNGNIIANLRSLTSTRRSITKGFTNSSAGTITNTLTPFNLVLPPGVLLGGVTYTFTLRCSINLGIGNGAGFVANTSASVTILTNAPPTPGRFSVAPGVGLELNTLFTLAAADWLDGVDGDGDDDGGDLPLHYQFSISSPTTSDSPLLLQSKSLLGYVLTILPGGDAADNFKLKLALVVFDNLGASSTASTSAVVRHLDPAALSSVLLDILTSPPLGPSLDGVKATISSTSSALNRVNCTLSPNCILLNRLSCLRTESTCGACKPGFIGDTGDRNTRCELPPSPATSLAHVHTVTEYDDSQRCVARCSHHGVCIFISISTNVPVSTCAVTDATCMSVCVCDLGWFGVGCQMDAEQLQTRFQLRDAMLSQLDIVMERDEFSPDTVSSWSGFLSSVTSRADELSVSSFVRLREMVRTTLQTGQEVMAGYEALAGVLSAVDAMMAALTSPSPSQAPFNAASMVSELLEAYTDIVHESMVHGQTDVEYVFSNLRITSAITRDEDGDRISMSVPRSYYEVLVQLSTSSVDIHASNRTFSNSSSSPSPPYSSLPVSVIQMHHKAYANSVNNILTQFYTDPVALRIRNNSVTSDTMPNTSSTSAGPLNTITFSLRNNNNLYLFTFGNETGGIYATECEGDSSVYVYTCAYTNVTITHNCTGYNGTYTSHCPVVMPTCRLLDALSSISSPTSSPSSSSYPSPYPSPSSFPSPPPSPFLTDRCSLVTHDAVYTVCECDVGGEWGNTSLPLYSP
ncbi:hypothetical protein EON64_10330, partial [archaeon]